MPDGYGISWDIDELIKKLTRIERKGLPRAMLYALNTSAFEVRDEWAKQINRVFDRPTPFTQRAPLYRKATTEKLQAEVFIRDEASGGGHPPAKYLAPEVFGGQRPMKGSERLLNRYWVPGKGVALDSFGNVKASQLNAVLSDIGVRRDAAQKSNKESRRKRGVRNRRKGKRGGNYFVVSTRKGRLRPGVYERLDTGFGSSVRSILFFVPRAPRYKTRYDVFALAQRIFHERFAFNFRRQLIQLVKLD